MSANQLSINSTAQRIVEARHPHQRGCLIIEVEEGGTADAVYFGFGDPDVTVNTGSFIKPGDKITISNTALEKPASLAIFALTASGEANVRIHELA